ncbi:MAG TPA: DUF6529 family protein [Baekduia sp.]
MEDALDSLMRGNVASVKAVLTTVALALAVYQLALIAVVYGRVRVPALAAPSASFAHRAAGDTIAALLACVAAACLAVYGFEDGMLVHGLAGAALVAVLAAKVAVVRLGLGLGDRLPLFGLTVFALLALTWATSAPDMLGGGE